MARIAAGRNGPAAIRGFGRVRPLLAEHALRCRPGALRVDARGRWIESGTVEFSRRRTRDRDRGRCRLDRRRCPALHRPWRLLRARAGDPDRHDLQRHSTHSGWCRHRRHLLRRGVALCRAGAPLPPGRGPRARRFAGHARLGEVRTRGCRLRVSHGRHRHRGDRLAYLRHTGACLCLVSRRPSPRRTRQGPAVQGSRRGPGPGRGGGDL